MAHRYVVLAWLVLAALGAAACGEGPDVTADSVGTSTTASEPREKPDPDSRAGAASGALVAEDMPVDEQGMNRVLDALPNDLLGRQRERDGGTVIYQAEDKPDLFLEVMEAEEVGVRDETNRELLEMTAGGEGRTVTESKTDPSAGVMYIQGTEGSGADAVHFLTWATQDGPFLFAAGADTSDALDALVNAFAKAAASV